MRAFDESVHQRCARGGLVLRMDTDSTVVCGRGTSTKESVAARERVAGCIISCMISSTAEKAVAGCSRVAPHP